MNKKEAAQWMLDNTMTIKQAKKRLEYCLKNCDINDQETKSNTNVNLPRYDALFILLGAVKSFLEEEEENLIISGDIRQKKKLPLPYSRYLGVALYIIMECNGLEDRDKKKISGLSI